MRKRFLLMVCWAWLFCTQGQKGSSNRQLSSSIAEIDPHIEKRGSNDEEVETADAKLHKARIQSSKAEATAAVTTTAAATAAAAARHIHC